MAAAYAAGVFSSLLGATIRSSRTFHRLEHLGRTRRAFTLYEESITDLLIAELTGREFEVTGSCPHPGCGIACFDWLGQPKPLGKRLRAKPLTKYQEGGNAAHGVVGTGADFVFSVPGAPLPSGVRLVYRMMIQAKRAQIGKPSKVGSAQYSKLLAAAKVFKAAPFYAFYVQQPDAHSSSPTVCRWHTSAAERSIVLVPAGDPGTVNYLPGMTNEAMLALGLPLRCLGGCSTVGSKGAAVTEAVGRFVRLYFPNYEPSDDEIPRHEVPTIEIDPEVWQTPRVDADEDQVLVVRLGDREEVTDLDRQYVGWHPGMTEDQLRDAARMWWVLSPDRAAKVKHVVAVAQHQVVGVYDTVGDPTVDDLSATRRVAFELAPTTQENRDRLARLASGLSWPQGAQNPVRYISLP